MKIGIDGRSLIEKRTGIGTYLYEIIKELNKTDKKNEFYIYSSSKIYLDFELNNNFHINEKVNLLNFILYPKMLKKDNIEIYWDPQYMLPMKLKNVKYVVTIADIALSLYKNIGSVRNTLIYKLTMKRTIKSADKIITISESSRRDIIKYYKVPESKIVNTYLACNSINNIDVPKKYIKEIEEKYKIKKNNFFFYLSTIEPRKNVLNMLKAFELFKEKNKNDTKFIVSGGLGWKCKNVLKFVENSKYNDDIILTGYISNIEKQYFYENCISFVYPSLYEGFGIPPLEAMKRGTIVITSDNSSLPEVCGNAALYLKNVNDTIELSNLYDKAVSLSEKEKDKLIERGFAQEKKFTWEKCSKETIKILYSIKK